MLTKNEAFFRIVFAVVLFLLSGTGLISGFLATICGILGTIELATALLRYSPLMELLDRYTLIRSSSKHIAVNTIKE